jgi:hypothetical protein
MIPNAKQLITDATLLLRKTYFTKKAMSDEMSRRLQKDAGRFYQIFRRNITNPEATSRHFMDSFYKVFQAELDSIKKEKHIQGPSDGVGFSKHHEDLLHSLFKAIDNNTALVLANQKLVEAQLNLLTKLPDP